jgi:hypothetical protein
VTRRNTVEWDPAWEDQLKWESLEDPKYAPLFFDHLVAATSDGPPETYAVVVQPLKFEGALGLMLRVISSSRPDEDLICNFVAAGESTEWPLTLERLRKTFIKQLFGSAAAALRLEMQMSTDPELRFRGPVRTRLRDEIVSFKQAALTEQLGVGRGGERNKKWTDDQVLKFLDIYEAAERRVSQAVKRYNGKDGPSIRRAMLVAANKKLPASERLPKSIIEKIAKDPGQLATPSTAEIALELAALEFDTDLNSYLPKVLTRARKLRSAKR